MRLTLIAITALLSGCLPGEVFYTCQLSDADQAIFAEAARIEGVEVIDWPAPGVWIVMYGSPEGNAAGTRPGLILVAKDMPRVDDKCPTPQLRLSVIRHEIRHTNGVVLHSDNASHVMHDPVPCYPTD